MYFFSSVKGGLPELLKRTTNGTGFISLKRFSNSFRKTTVLRDYAIARKIISDIANVGRDKWCSGSSPLWNVIKETSFSGESRISLKITLSSCRYRRAASICLLYTSDAADDLLCVDL